MSDPKPKKNRRKRITSTLWGALLGVLLGTACSSALAPLIKTPWLKGLLVDGFKLGIPEFSTSLGFFNLTLGFSFRFTLLSAVFMVTAALLLFFMAFPKDP